MPAIVRPRPGGAGGLGRRVVDHDAGRRGRAVGRRDRGRRRGGARHPLVGAARTRALGVGAGHTGGVGQVPGHQRQAARGDERDRAGRGGDRHGQDQRARKDQLLHSADGRLTSLPMCLLARLCLQHGTCFSSTMACRSTPGAGWSEPVGLPGEIGPGPHPARRRRRRLRPGPGADTSSMPPSARPTWTLDPVDLVVYRDGGLIVRHVSPAYDPHHASPLYDWTGQNGVQFTYPPFAAVIFAVASVLSWTAMRWAMTLASLAALGLSLWLVFGALGYRDRPAVRLGATLGVSALALATEPVQQTLALGQVNLLLMLLVVADLLTAGALTPGGRTRWWHGFGIGIAAGVKLTPLIFIPYLLLIRRYRQAATATGGVRGHGGARLRDPAA